MSKDKKAVRAKFRDAVFKRDNYKCKVCKFDIISVLDAHHITSRTVMPGGGYVPENGITLCPSCHLKAESFEYSADELYKLINSSFELALKASREFDGNTKH